MEFLPQVKYSKVSVFSDHTPARPYKKLANGLNKDVGEHLCVLPYK
jgi:hypothetical protein